MLLDIQPRLEARFQGGAFQDVRSQVDEGGRLEGRTV